MSFGIVLSLFNSRYFQKPLNIYCEFIPQLIFMLSIFGYLCFLIIYKWFQNFAGTGRTAPGLLNTLIFMFLRMGKVDPKEQLFEGQVR
jgi:V-type H+-transporting ATPase subunit a